MGENTTDLTAENFDNFLKEGNAVIDFWADWCGPCKMLGPVVDEVAGEMKGKINFGKVDIDSNSELAQRFQVMSIPTLIFFKDGQQVNRSAGAVPKDELEGMIRESF